MVYLTRKAEFSASHYYHSPEFTPEENRRVFGKCNNPNGHGHNYTLELSIAGDVDPATGMIANLSDLDGFVKHAVLEAAILATRLHLIPLAEVAAEFRKFRTIVEKTGGPSESEAMAFLTGYLSRAPTGKGTHA